MIFDTIREKLKPLANPSLLRLTSYLPVHRSKIAISIVFMVIAGFSSSLIALLLGKLTDLGFYEQAPWVVLAAPVGLMLVATLHGGSMFMSNYLLGKVSQSILMKIRKEIFHNILRWPSTAYQDSPTGVISSKFIFEGNFALGGATKSVITLVRDSCQVVALTTLLFWNNWKLALFSFVIAPFIFFLLKTIAGKLKSVMAKSQANLGFILVLVKKIFDDERLIKLSNTYDEERDRFFEVNRTLKDMMIRMARVGSFGEPVTQLIFMCGVAVVLTAAMIQNHLGLITIGDFVTFLTALLLIMPPLKHLAGLNGTFIMLGVASESLFAAMDQALEDNQGTEKLNTCRGEVTFDQVQLRYPEATSNAVENLSFTIKPGQSVAFVGLSGSGKTSAVNMLPRFWNPTAGKILIDGVDTQTLTLESLREQIAIVSQDVLLMEGSIRDNIAYANSNATPETIDKVVEATALTDFIASLPKGLDTEVGEAGDKLSGGQKQRISIARALLRDTPILILDEATSALDSVSENKIKKALDILMKGRTTFIVAHRLSTIENADLVIVMDKGEVVEMGTRSELLDKQGVFAQLCQLQNINKEEAL